MNTKGFTRMMFLILFLLPVMAFSQADMLDNMPALIRGGNSREVAKYFDNNVEITILDRESTYSRVQAEMVLRDFFSKNSVQSLISFTGVHQEKVLLTALVPENRRSDLSNLLFL